ncbi:MAG TPA: acyl-CoA thioester hydrolase/BAAT C-terminal domain-containing protein [Caulobacteraceae bacterium]|nr:acyl-CoA thioester hydrolase/BAAT C-terminal domain-containing protein [Caulobacteraceae bacterium]
MTWWRFLRSLVLSIVLTTILGHAAPAAAQPSITASPSDVVEGEPVRVAISGLEPGQTVTVHASRMWARFPVGQERYYGRSSFTADARGQVKLADSRPLVGSAYDRPDAAGLFWSMQPVRRLSAAGLAPPQGLAAVEALAPGTVVLEVEVAGRLAARVDVRLRPAAADVAVREVRAPGVTGVFAQPGGPGLRRAVIVLGGSEGGLATARDLAPLLASRGYAVLGLAYFQGEERDLIGLRPNLELIPLETLEAARRWLAAQPGVDAGQVAVVGVSKGAELALVAAATYPWVSLVGAFAPSHVVWEGIPPDDDPNRSAGSSWTLGDRPLPFVRWSQDAARRGEAARAATGVSRLTEVHLESLVEYASDIEQARIRMERSRAAVFIAAGQDDGMWPSAYAAEQLRTRLERRDPRLPVQIELAPTGHQILGAGWSPTTAFQRPTGLRHGGDARLDSEAQRAIWPRFLAFLEAHYPPADRDPAR